MIYACGIRGRLNAKVVGLAFGAGSLAHIFLGVGYGLLKIGVINGTGLLTYAVVLSFTPIFFVALGSRFISPDLLGPIHCPRRRPPGSFSLEPTLSGPSRQSAVTVTSIQRSTQALDLQIGQGIIDPIQHWRHQRRRSTGFIERGGEQAPAVARALIRLGVVTSTSTCRPALAAAFTNASRLN